MSENSRTVGIPDGQVERLSFADGRRQSNLKLISWVLERLLHVASSKGPGTAAHQIGQGKRDNMHVLFPVCGKWDLAVAECLCILDQRFGTSACLHSTYSRQSAMSCFRRCSLLHIGCPRVMSKQRCMSKKQSCIASETPECFSNIRHRCCKRFHMRYWDDRAVHPACAYLQTSTWPCSCDNANEKSHFARHAGLRKAVSAHLSKGGGWLVASPAPFALGAAEALSHRADEALCSAYISEPQPGA